MPEVSVQDLIRKTATGLGVPPELALAVAEHESSFNPSAMGPEIPSMPGVRAIGTFQLLPETAKQFGVDPSDPAQNIVGGVRYLRQLLDQNEGDLPKVLATYGGFKKTDPTEYTNKILGSLSKYQGVPPETTGVAPGGRASGAGPTGVQPGAPQPGGRTGGPGTPTGPTMAGATSTFSGLDELVRPFDPLQPEGRQNLAAGVGAAALTAAVPEVGLPAMGMRIAPWIARTIAGPLGASFGGAAAEATEEAIGTQPTTPGAVTNAGLTQGAYELGGQAILWPIKRVARGFLGAKVARDAKEALDIRMRSAIDARGPATRAARADVADGIAAARAMTRASTDAAEGAATQVTRQSKKASAARLAQVEIDNSALIATAREQYDTLIGQPPSIQGTAGAVRQVLEGPAKAALDKAGEKIATVAATGPDLSMRPIKDALTEITKKFRPDSIFGQVDAAVENPIGFAIGAGAQQKLVAQYGSMEAANEALGIARALNLPADHPLPGILGKVQNAPETITFADAHKLKMLLDEAVNWDRVAKRNLEKITKGLRGVLREELGSYEPYNTATAAYQAVIPLYRRGIGRQITRASIEAPDKIATMLKANKPSDALALKQLLVDQSAAGGDPKLGQEAWDSVRAAWTHSNLISGGIEGLKDRVKSLLVERPEFAQITFGDMTGLRVLSNLDAIAEAYTHAVGTADAKLLATKTAGKTAEELVHDAANKAVRDVRAKGAAQMAQAKAAGQTDKDTVAAAIEAGVSSARDAKRALKESSLRQGTVFGQGADIMRAIFQGPQSVWGALSIMRLMQGPTGADLVQYAAYSPAFTQKLVGVLTGQVPDRIVGDTLREAMGVLNPTVPAPVSSHTQEPVPSGPIEPAASHAR